MEVVVRRVKVELMAMMVKENKENVSLELITLTVTRVTLVEHHIGGLEHEVQTGKSVGGWRRLAGT